MSKTKSNQSLSFGFEQFYLNESLADVYFTFNSTAERVPAHKVVVSAKSDVFKTIFIGKMKKKNEIQIDDATVDAFKKFLQFFYAQDVNLNMNEIEGVLYLGKKYLVDRCLSICKQFLVENVTDENVCFVYGLSVRFDLDDIKKRCELRIGVNAKNVFKSKAFMECNRQVLSHILKLESLSCSGTEKFDACMNWVKSVSKKKTLNAELVSIHLGDLFGDIGFESMTTDEVNSILSNYKNAFTAKKRKEIMQSISSASSTKTKPNAQLYTWNKDEVIKCKRKHGRNCETEYGTYEGIGKFELNANESLTFSSTVPLLFKGIVCAGMFELFKGQTLVEMVEQVGGEITISEYQGDAKQSQVLYTGEFKNANGRKIEIPNAIVIKPGCSYEIDIEMEDWLFQGYPICAKYAYENRDVKMVKDGFIIKFVDKSLYHQTKCNLIDALLFNKV